MIGALFLVIFFYFIASSVLSSMKSKYKWLEIDMLKRLYFYHYLFAILYYWYSLNNSADSNGYYKVALNTPLSWFDLYATGTGFIHFLGYPFVRYLFFTYEMMMALFAFIGYWGFVYFYIYFRENLNFLHKWNGYDLIILIMFLPNMHFWTVALGKDSLIFTAIAMVAFAISSLGTRKIPLIIGLIIIYHIRPHIFLFLCVGLLFGLFAGRAKVPTYQKVLVFAAGIAVLAVSYNSILKFVSIDTANVTGSFETLAMDRAGHLAKSGSGLDISNYSLPVKLFTFWFRPLFVDAGSALGLVVSFENLFYLILATKLFQRDFFGFLLRSSTLIKSSVMNFITLSIALSFVMANLGIIIRQKSMVMYFFFFIVLSFMDYKKSLKYKSRLVAPAT